MSKTIRTVPHWVKTVVANSTDRSGKNKRRMKGADGSVRGEILAGVRDGVLDGYTYCTPRGSRRSEVKAATHRKLRAIEKRKMRERFED